MNKFVKIVCVCGLSLSWLASPTLTKADPGESGWPILEKIQSARFGGISANAPFTQSGIGFLYNPAMLSTVNERSLLFHSELGFYEDLLAGAFYHEPGLKVSWGVGLVYYDVGQVELNWIENYQVVSETVTASRDILGLVSGGFQFNDYFRTGATLKVGHSELAERSSAMVFAADVGALFMPEPEWAISFAARNLGISTKYLEADVALPATLYLGTGYALTCTNIQLLPGAGVAYNIVDGTVLPELGLEFGYDILSLTAGYRFNLEEANLHFGVGIHWNAINLKYAFIPGNYLDASHRITLGLSFGSGEQPAKTSAVPPLKRIKNIPKVKTDYRQVESPKKSRPPSKSVEGNSIPKVRQLKLKNVKNRLAISWQAPKSKQTYRYNIYFKKGSGRYNLLNRKPLKARSFFTKTLKRNKTYSVIVKTVDADGQESKRHKPKKIRLY